MKKHQNGSALLVVISVLAASLIIGVSSMQSSHVGERLAGSQRASTKLSMSAERAGAAAFSMVRSDLSTFLKNEECSSDDFFLPINAEGGVIDFNSKGAIDEETMLPAERGDFIANWEFLSALDTFASLESGPCVSVLPVPIDFADEDCSDLLEKEGINPTSDDIECSYRFVTLYDSSEEKEVDRVKRYIVAMARMVSGESGTFAESLPLFIEVEYADININWLFDGPPIAFLADDFDTDDVTISGANNMNLNGKGGYEISLPSSVYKSSETQKYPGSGNQEWTPLDFFRESFSTNTATPSITDGDIDIGEFITFIEGLRSASIDYSVPNIHYVTEDPDMSAYDAGDGDGEVNVLVVADNFTWRGKNNFRGIIIVLGAQVKYSGGGSGDLYGSLIHAPITPDSPTYDWIDSNGFVEFPEVERFLVEDGWQYGNSNFEFDFSGGGSSTLENDAEALDFAQDSAESAPGFAKATSWETE
ncbi:pilus assembly PilX family protein [Halomonas tibetensis]|uniref:Type 4 fimbrial biogenesis protein PilX N-terminal domain-containing protein n=1 Tax=Halomonas tibetensis TaxID=2259590 RepID=A0ABV7B9J2_9GAMM